MEEVEKWKRVEKIIEKGERMKEGDIEFREEVEEE